MFARIAASIPVLLGCASALSQEGVSIAQPERKREIVIAEASRVFDTSLFGQAIPGCAVEENRSVCRSDSNPVTKFATNVVTRRGWGSTLQESSLSEGCVVLKIRLSVDNSGPGGKVCREPSATVIVQVELD